MWRLLLAFRRCEELIIAQDVEGGSYLERILCSDWVCHCERRHHVQICCYHFVRLIFDRCLCQPFYTSGFSAKYHRARESVIF